MLTQVASSFLGDTTESTALEKLTGVKSTIGNIIHFTHGKRDEILSIATAKDVVSNVHHKSLKDSLETYECELIGERNYDEHIVKGNRVIVPGEYQEELVEFTIDEVVDKREYGKGFEVFSYASYLDLKKAKVIDPSSFRGTAEQHAHQALYETEYEVGVVESDSEITISFENHTNPFEYLKRIAREFELELNFRVEHNGLMVTNRIVDLVDQIGAWRGREVTFGKDLQSIERKESGDIYTSLIGLGPEREDGSRLEVLVEDYEALERWGRPEYNPQHLIGVYEPESDREEMTLSELRQYTRTELDKRKNSVINYEINFLDLEHMLNHENKKIRFGDTIRIKDTKYTPYLYIQARIFEMKRNPITEAEKEYVLGDFIEFTEDEIKSIYNYVKRQLSKKAGIEMLLNYAEPKKILSDNPPTGRNEHVIWVDTSRNPHVAKVFNNGQWEKLSPTEPSEIGAYNKKEVDDKAEQALKDAKAYAENADNIKSGVIDVGAVPIRTSMTGARIDWDGVNGLVQYDMQGNPVSWINLEAEAYFKDAYLSGRVEAKEGYFGDNLRLVDGKIQIQRPDGAVWMQDGLVKSNYSVFPQIPEMKGVAVWNGVNSHWAFFVQLQQLLFVQSEMFGGLDGRGIDDVIPGNQVTDVRDSSYRWSVRYQRFWYVHNARYLRVRYQIANHSRVGKHAVDLYEVEENTSGKAVDNRFIFEKGDYGEKELIADLGIPTYESRGVDFRIGWTKSWNDKNEFVRFRILTIEQTDYV